MDGGMECALLRETAATHCYKHSPTLDSSLSLLLIHPTSPVDLDSPSTMTNSPCHTPQLDPCLERPCVCCVGKKGSGLCYGVCHLLSHNTLGIVCVFVCGQRGLVPGGPSCKDAVLLLVKRRI